MISLFCNDFNDGSYFFEKLLHLIKNYPELYVDEKKKEKAIRSIYQR